MTGETKTLFLVGVGYIGGSILHRLLEQRKDIKVTALTRSDEQARVLESLGVAPLRGTLDDVDIIKQAAATHDVSAHDGAQRTARSPQRRE